MSKEVCDARPDVTRIDGGYMKLPGIRLNFKMGPPILRENGTRTENTFACLTETMISTLIGDNDHHVGAVDVEFAKKMLQKAKERNFHLAPLTNFSIPVDLRR